MRRLEAPSDVWDLLLGALAARAVGIAAELGVADALADGPTDVRALARPGVDAETLRRILRALASVGVFEETERGVFRNTPASEGLRRDGGLDDFARLFGGVWHRAAGELSASGGETFRGIHETDFWTWLGRHPSERASFDRAMAQSWEWKVERAASVSWRGDETVVDVGGGNGALLVELVRRHPGLRGIVFDLPETTRDEQSLGERVDFVAGSFFDTVPVGDAYIVSTILHDWNDVDAGRILGTIRAAAPAHARLIVIDAVVADGNEPSFAKWLDLLMLALFDGCERDERQWRTLLTESGFEPVHVEDGLIEARCR